jgi:hypothetical protein
MLLGFLLLSSQGSAQVNNRLAGAWIMDDASPALMYPANKKAFTVLRVAPGKSRWADGYFFMKWSNAARPERGYYSLETERVWVTTYRWVNQEEERVEYRGVVTLDDKGNVVWRGTASTTGSRKLTWKFEARKN